jgi:hypothetical protein
VRAWFDRIAADGVEMRVRDAFPRADQQVER